MPTDSGTPRVSLYHSELKSFNMTNSTCNITIRANINAEMNKNEVKVYILKQQKLTTKLTLETKLN